MIIAIENCKYCITITQTGKTSTLACIVIWIFKLHFLKATFLIYCATCRFHLYLLENANQSYFTGKTFTAYFTYMWVLHLNVSVDAYSNCSFVKIVCYKLHKHEVFQLYVSKDDYSKCISLKIVCYKFHKHKAFHLYVAADDDAGCFL